MKIGKFFFLFFSVMCFAKQTICLNMIVKDEAQIICRCLDSVKDIIDYWLIVDTGSTDGTQEVIKKHMKDIPGELHERPWKNWGATRTEAFELAKGKGDYILFMDADDILEFEKEFSLGELTADLYNMWRGNESFSYIKPQIVRGDLPWKWIGVTHEYLGCDEFFSETVLDGVHYTSIDDGATRKTGVEKFWKNVRLLEEGLKEEPGNSRYMFYLGESYRDCNEKGKALEWYQKRVKVGGWDEEVFWSKLQIGHCLRDLGLPTNIVIEAYRDAFNFRPSRIEPIYYMAEIYNKEGNYSKAYEILKIVDFLPRPEKKDICFNEDWISNYGILSQLSISSYYVGHYQESIDACEKLISMENIPEDWKKQAEINMKFPLEKMAAQRAE